MVRVLTLEAAEAEAEAETETETEMKATFEAIVPEATAVVDLDKRISQRRALQQSVTAPTDVAVAVDLKPLVPARPLPGVVRFEDRLLTNHTLVP